MRTVYRTHFELAPKTGEVPCFDATVSIVLRWVGSRPGTALPQGIDFQTEAPRTAVGERRSVETRRYDGPNGRTWGCRVGMPDAEPDVEWVTEVVVHEAPDERIWFSCLLQIGRSGEVLSPVFRPANRPGIVREILGVYNGRGILALSDQPLLCGESDADILIRLLESESRRHPIVFISTDAEGLPVVDCKRLAETLAGMAYVIVAKGPEVSEKLGEVLPDRLSCFNAGMRLYWPGFRRSDDPLRHPLWIRSRILQIAKDPTGSIGHGILRRIAAVSSYTTSSNFVSWTTIADWQRVEAIAAARAENRQDELLELYEETVRDLDAKVATLKAELQEKADEVNRLRSLSENYRTALESMGGEEAGSALEANFDTVAEAIEQAERQFGGQLAFCWNSKSEDADSPFEDARSVFLALKWLATDYHDSRTGRKPCPDRDVAVRQAVPGWAFSNHQSKKTMTDRRHREWYHAKHDGREFSLPEHLKCGSGTDARHNIRIAFNWDDESEKVVLGFLGQHQQNDAS
jgi:hypothetical protein